MDDSNFGTAPHLMPNIEFTCPNCSKPILVRWGMGSLTDERLNSLLDLNCQKCGWSGSRPLRLGRQVGDLANE
jgi:hypothetical protein